MPTFGVMRMVDVLPGCVREWVAALSAAGVTPATIRHSKIVLSAIFTTALNDQTTLLQPCRGVKTPTVPVKAFRIVTPEQFDALYAALTDENSRLLVETAIDSGLRWGELTELRSKDLDPSTGILTVSRAVVQVDSKFHPQGGRFHVKPYPKSRLSRRLKLSRPVVDALVEHQRAYRLSPDDLLFPASGVLTSTPLRLVVDEAVEDPGLTEPNDKGRQYVHGTLSAYTAGRCRCPRCRRAIADYRAGRRADGKDSPREPRRLDTDGHLPRDRFSRHVWQPAVRTAGLEAPLRLHDLRHAHTSWLLAGGADLEVVKERLGHASIATTERHLHTLPDADETALDALACVRGRTSRARQCPESCRQVRQADRTLARPGADSCPRRRGPLPASLMTPAPARLPTRGRTGRVAPARRRQAPVAAEMATGSTGRSCDRPSTCRRGPIGRAYPTEAGNELAGLDGQSGRHGGRQCHLDDAPAAGIDLPHREAAPSTRGVDQLSSSADGEVVVQGRRAQTKVPIAPRRGGRPAVPDQRRGGCR